MGSFSLLASTLLMSVLPAVAVAADARSWGAPEKGLRMSVSVVEEAGVDPAFEIAIQNIGQTDVSYRSVACSTIGVAAAKKCESR